MFLRLSTTYTYKSIVLITLFSLIIFSGQHCIAAVEVETLSDSVVPLPEHLQMYAHVIARVQQWAKAKNTDPKLTGVRIPNAGLDLNVQVWFRAIDLASYRIVSRFAAVPRIMLYGPSGTGKSHACNQIVEQSKHINPAVKSIHIDCSSLVTEWQNSGATAIRGYREETLKACEKGIPVIVLLEELHAIASINKQRGESAQDAQSSAAVELTFLWIPVSKRESFLLPLPIILMIWRRRCLVDLNRLNLIIAINLRASN